MFASFRWIISPVVLWCALLWWHGWGVVRLGVGSVTVFRSVYGFGYFVLGVVLLGAVARLWPGAGAPLWRLTMVVTGSGIALAQVWLVYLIRAVPPSLDTWMVALLGIAIASILPRLLPDGLLRRWLVAERRTAGR